MLRVSIIIFAFFISMKNYFIVIIIIVSNFLRCLVEKEVKSGVINNCENGKDNETVVSSK